MGRPTDYRPHFCEQVIELGKLGKSKAQMAAAMDCSRMSIDQWCKDYPEFSDAIAHARDLAMSWWEDQAQTGMWQSPNGDKLNPQLWSRSMAARFPDDYREARELVGKGGGPIQSQVIIATGVPHADDSSDLA